MHDIDTVSIVGFDEYYLTPDLRRGRIYNPTFVKIPCSEGAENDALIHDHPDGWAHLGIWVQMQKWAMRNWKLGGRFVRKTGAPMTVEAIACGIGSADIDLVKTAIERLSDDAIGWLSMTCGSSGTPSGTTNGTAPGAERRGEERRGEDSSTCRQFLIGGLRSAREGDLIDEILAAAARWKGSELATTTAEVQWWSTWAEQQATEAAEIGGEAVRGAELALRAVQHAIEQERSYGSKSSAIRYVTAIVERCRRDGLLPGDFPYPNNGQLRQERKY